MRSAFIVCILAACLLAPSIAAAADHDPYVGVELGRTTALSSPNALSLVHSLGFSAPYSPAQTVISSSNLRSTSSEVEVGFWFNSYVGLQAGYQDMGTFSESTRIRNPHGTICYAACTSDFSDSGEVKVQGVALAFTGRVPLPYGFELLGRAGVFLGHSTYDEQLVGMPDVPPTESTSVDHSASDLGVGLGWRFTSHWGIQLWWDKYPQNDPVYYGNSYFSEPHNFDVRGYSLAVQYHF